MASTFGSKRKEGYLMQPWEHSMKQRFVKPFVIFFFINFQKIMIQKILIYAETMDQQYQQRNHIYKELNHPPSILRQIPLPIESRLSKHSSNEKIFKESTQIYQEALRKSRCDHQLTCQKSIHNKNEETKQRKGKIIWFNPLYSKNVLTEVGN